MPLGKDGTPRSHMPAFKDTLWAMEGCPCSPLSAPAPTLCKVLLTGRRCWCEWVFHRKQFSLQRSALLCLGSGECNAGCQKQGATTGLARFDKCPGTYHQVNICVTNSQKNELAEHYYQVWIWTSGTHCVCSIRVQCFLGSTTSRRVAAGKWSCAQPRGE